MVGFDNDVFCSRKPASSSSFSVQRDITDDINVRLGESATPSGVITSQTIMGIFVAIVGFGAVVFAIYLLYHKRNIIRENGEALLERAFQLPLHHMRVHTNERESWSYNVPRHGEQLPPYSPPSSDNSHRRGAQARAFATPGPPPPAYLPGDNAYLSFNGGPP